MKAVVKYGQRPGEVELRDVAEPELRPGCVLVAVRAAGVCGWDIEMWQHRMAGPVTVPVIQGHEFSGVIAQIGGGVQGWRIGDRVACETSAVVCGQCWLCRAGEYQLCPQRKGFGYGVDGAFTSYVVVRQAILHRVAEELSFEEAALAEPFCVGYHALMRRIRVARGDAVLIIGPGPIGLICMQVARLAGARRTILVGRSGDEARMETAREHGWADHLLLSDRDEALRRVLELTDSRGADVVADCAGNAAALKTALECVRRGGQIVKLGWGPEPFNHSLDDLLRKSISLVGTFGHNWDDWEAVLALLAARRLDAQALISDVMPIERWREAFERVEYRQAIKIVLTPEDSAA